MNAIIATLLCFFCGMFFYELGWRHGRRPAPGYYLSQPRRRRFPNPTHQDPADPA